MVQTLGRLADSGEEPSHIRQLISFVRLQRPFGAARIDDQAPRVPSPLRCDSTRGYNPRPLRGRNAIARPIFTAPHFTPPFLTPPFFTPPFFMLPRFTSRSFALCFFVLPLFVLALSSGPARAQFVPQPAEPPPRQSDPAVALAEGIFADDVLRDPAEAAAWFRNVIASDAALAPQRQEAAWRLARCLRRLNRPDAARPMLESLLRDATLPERLRLLAREELAAMPLVAPARLMPADTLFYVEIPNPGETIAQWSAVLRRAGLETQARRILALALRERGALEVGALFSEAMEDDLRKIDALGIGWHNFRVEEVNGVPAIRFDNLLVLHTGQSATAASILRGVVVALLVPETSVEGIGFFAPAGPDAEFRYAMTEGLFVACTDARAGADAVLRHNGGRRGPTLYASAGYKSRPKSPGNPGDALLYADAARLVALAERVQPGPDGSSFLALCALLGLRELGPLFATVGVQSDRLVLDLTVSTPRDGLLLRLLRTPAPSSDPGWSTPRGAALTVSALLDPADRRWLDFERILMEAGRLFGTPEGEPLAAARLIERGSGLRLADDVFAPLSGGTLVWMAGVGEDRSEGFPPFVLTLDLPDPAGWVRRIERGMQRLFFGEGGETPLARTAYETPVGRIETITVLGVGFAWHVQGRRVTISTSASAVVQALAAPKVTLRPTRFGPTPNKWITLRLDVLVQRAFRGALGAQADVPALEVMTWETDDRMRVRVEQEQVSRLVELLAIGWLGPPSEAGGGPSAPSPGSISPSPGGSTATSPGSP
ncbi:MAG: tetratricopeptide repeat protein [Planctomycetia bacterium]|nr:MAG: tetratricopeptide repeat protein [Planctomycetia bacterium]